MPLVPLVPELPHPQHVPIAWDGDNPSVCLSSLESSSASRGWPGGCLLKHPSSASASAYVPGPPSTTPVGKCKGSGGGGTRVLLYTTDSSLFDESPSSCPSPMNLSREVQRPERWGVSKSAKHKKPVSIKVLEVKSASLIQSISS